MIKFNTYKFRLFLTSQFIFLSLIGLACTAFLFLYVINVHITVNLNMEVCDRMNNISLSIVTGYLVSYFTYLFVNHIPEYKEKLYQDSFVSSKIYDYGYILVNCMGYIALYFKTHKTPNNLNDIPEIRELLESNELKYKIRREAILLMDSTDLKKDVDKLEQLFPSLVSIGIRSSFSSSLIKLQTNVWEDRIKIIINGFINPINKSVVEIDKETLDLIRITFCLISKSEEIGFYSQHKIIF